jgi:alkylation response protein AidB-like acyl-CoA dehydrogenase
MLYGSDEQKKSWLPRIADGTDIWCTLYSEPGAGSDLAALQTRAVRDGDEYVINGQKIWTTFGHYADLGFLAVRTDPNAPKHRGISTIAVPMNSPGITIQPLVNMAGAHDFNQIYFEDVRVPVSNRIGEENRGWYHVAVALDFERSSVGSIAIARRVVDDMVAHLKAYPAASTPHLRHRIAELQIEVQVLRNLSYYTAALQTKGMVPTREAQIIKLFGAELSQRATATALQMFGMGGLGHGPDGSEVQAAFDYLNYVSATIGGGTSEIQRQVIAGRGLGLPRE